MYITLTSAQHGDEAATVRTHEAARDSLLGADGFRWSMLLRSSEDATSFAIVSMWQTPEHESAWREACAGPAPQEGFDVATARGSMTPAAAAAIVRWTVEPQLAQRFAARWNAAYHAIEADIGSRLLRELESPSAYVGLHVVTDPARLDPNTLSAELTDPEGLAIAPDAVERYDVILLTEAP